MRKPYTISARELEAARAARDIMETEPAAAHTIRRLCQRTGTNACSLKRTFRQLCGHSIRQYLTRIRMEMASAMIREGCPVGEAGRACGYTNMGHFRKLLERFEAGKAAQDQVPGSPEHAVRVRTAKFFSSSTAGDHEYPVRQL